MRLWHFIDFNTGFKTITTRGTGNYRRGDYHCYVGVGQLSHHGAVSGSYGLNEQIRGLLF